MAAAVAQKSRGARDSEVIALGSAAGEDNLGGFAAKDKSGAVPGFIEDGPGLAADMMDAGGIAEDFVEKRQHDVANQRVKRCRRIVIEIDRTHVEGIAASNDEYNPR